jgi:hypothetical protein
MPSTHSCHSRSAITRIVSSGKCSSPTSPPPEPNTTKQVRTTERERLRAAVKAIPPSHDAAHWGLAGHPNIIGADDQCGCYIRDEVLALLAPELT